jgi:phage baseplate assembly protein W
MIPGFLVSKKGYTKDINTSMSTLLQSDKSGKTSNVARQRQYRDLDLSLALHPIRKDIIPLKDDRAIRNAVKNLLLTNFYERPFNHGIGANLRALLFEPADAITRMAIEDNVRRTIQDHEPRVKILDVRVNNLEDQNAYNLLVRFLIKEYDTKEEVEILLRRIR